MLDAPGVGLQSNRIEHRDGSGNGQVAKQQADLEVVAAHAAAAAGVAAGICYRADRQAARIHKSKEASSAPLQYVHVIGAEQLDILGRVQTQREGDDGARAEDVTQRLGLQANGPCASIDALEQGDCVAGANRRIAAGGRNAACAVHGRNEQPVRIAIFKIVRACRRTGQHGRQIGDVVGSRDIVDRAKRPEDRAESEQVAAGLGDAAAVAVSDAGPFVVGGQADESGGADGSGIVQDVVARLKLDRPAASAGDVGGDRQVVTGGGAIAGSQHDVAGRGHRRVDVEWTGPADVHVPDGDGNRAERGHASVQVDVRGRRRGQTACRGHKVHRGAVAVADRSVGSQADRADGSRRKAGIGSDRTAGDRQRAANLAVGRNGHRSASRRRIVGIDRHVIDELYSATAKCRQGHCAVCASRGIGVDGQIAPGGIGPHDAGADKRDQPRGTVVAGLRVDGDVAGDDHRRAAGERDVAAVGGEVGRQRDCRRGQGNVPIGGGRSIDRLIDVDRFRGQRYTEVQGP